MISIFLASALILHNGKCVGSQDCKSCKSCSSCSHCAKENGSCGVCKPSDNKIIEDNICTRVIDGDTIEVIINGKKTSVRLIGVDTPELTDPRPEIKLMANKAKKFTAKIVLGKKVAIKQDNLNKRDRYNRLLCYITVDGILLNEEIIKEGYGFAYVKFPFDSTKMKNFQLSEREARQSKKGMWSTNDLLDNFILHMD